MRHERRFPPAPVTAIAKFVLNDVIDYDEKTLDKEKRRPAMRAWLQIGVSLLAATAILLALNGPGWAQSVRLPQFTVTDQAGTLVGAFFSAGSIVSSPSENFVRVLRRDTANDENYTLYVGPQFLQGVSEDDVFYTNADCTGDAYVLDSSNFSDLSALRGSVYVVGRKAGATDEDSLILRAAGAGSDNSSLMMSRYRTSLVNGPTCNNGAQTFPTSSPTVLAVQVDDLSGLTRPFKAQ